MVDSLHSLEELQARLNAWLVEYRKLPEAISLAGEGLEMPSAYVRSHLRLVGWFKKFHGNLRGDLNALKRLDQVVSKATEHPSRVAQHQISICIQDLMVGNLQLAGGTIEPDGPVGCENSGVWRHAGKVVSGLGTGKAFQIFYEAHSSGIGSRIACGKFDIAPKVAVRGVAKIIEKIEKETHVPFDWQIKESRPFHVTVIPRKEARPDRGTKKVSKACKPAAKKTSGKPSKKASTAKPKRKS